MHFHSCLCTFNMLRQSLFVLFFALCFSPSYAQGEKDFCDAVTAILRDAPNRFRNIRGKVTDGNISAEVWESGIKVPGTIASRFVASHGMFYEGALYQTKKIQELQPVYYKYKKMMDNCMLPKGMTLSTSDNFYTGLEAYKKCAYLPPTTGEPKLEDMPGHVALLVDYRKDNGTYTIELYIYEH